MANTLPVPESEQRVVDNLLRDLNETYPDKMIVRHNRITRNGMRRSHVFIKISAIHQEMNSLLHMVLQ